MSYAKKDFQHLLGTRGFSDKLLKNHFGLYQGCVDSANQSLKQMEKLEAAGEKDTSQFQQLQRQFRWNVDGMRLHELYFENMGGKGTREKGLLAEQLAEQFGSVKAWAEDFKTTASMEGIGWAVLCQDHHTGNLNNLWIDEEHVGNPVEGTPLLVLDAWEHAYMADYNLNRPDYIHTFFQVIDWDVVENRIKS